MPSGAARRDRPSWTAGEETNDSFYLGEVVIEPGFPGPPPHRHERVHDMFYVLDGTLTMRLGDETLELEPGSFVCVPTGVIHTFSNRTDAPVQLLNFNTPAGWENYMRDLAAVLASGTPTQEEIGRIASRYDFEVVNAPLTGTVALERCGSVLA
jgi:mannose-6-phosphate isomerase-like protein (cupin superfamily)